MLKTEMRNEFTTNLDQMSSIEIVRVMNEENKNMLNAVDTVLEDVADAVEAIVKVFEHGGRLFYIGAGTSGRLGVLDASECPPTFGVGYDKVIGIIAGGDSALRKASEGAEDSGEAGVEDLKKYAVSSKDVVCGISAAGGAEYVLEALKYAKGLGCVTIGVTSNKESALDKLADISICPDTGAEVLTGSTRLKAGTAQKVVLNMLTTAAMVCSGYVYENLMINLKPTNKKLTNRMIGIVRDILDCTEEQAKVRLQENHWNIREAVKA